MIKCAAGIQAHLVSMLLIPSQSATASCTQYEIKSLRSQCTKVIHATEQAGKANNLQNKRGEQLEREN